MRFLKEALDSASSFVSQNKFTSLLIMLAVTNFITTSFASATESNSDNYVTFNPTDNKEKVFVAFKQDGAQGCWEFPNITGDQRADVVQTLQTVVSVLVSEGRASCSKVSLSPINYEFLAECLNSGLDLLVQLKHSGEVVNLVKAMPSLSDCNQGTSAAFRNAL